MNLTDALQAGTIIDGKYRIVKILGQGGFGITYLAIDMSLDREVAIKEFFPKNYCQRNAGDSTVTPVSDNFKDFTEKLRERFVKEARHIAKLKHPGIVSIMSAFDQNGTSYYVMDIINGGSLESIVREQGPMPLERAVNYIEKVGDALSFVHSKRVNHLDIKPSNIMVSTEEDMPVLIDFGLAKQYDQSGHATSTVLTGMSHGYAPYEQYIENGVSDFSPETDVYSLAATLYYILTGVVPPQAMTLIDGNLPFPDNMPRQVRPVLRKAMSVNKPMRHHSVKEFVADLRNALAAETVIVKPQPPKPEKPKTETAKPAATATPSNASKRRNTIITVAIIVVCVMISIIIGLAKKGSAEASANDSDTLQIVAVEEVPTVTDTEITLSPDVKFTYTGPVDEYGMPQGEGKGIYKDGEYSGHYEAGLRQGQGTFKAADESETFEGTFKDDQYDNGKVVFENGTWYEGTFQNGDSYTGTYYSADGKVEGTIKNGKLNKK